MDNNILSAFKANVQANAEEIRAATHWKYRDQMLDLILRLDA